MAGPSVVIVSPAHDGANNGNARTAQRWAGMLPGCEVRIVPSSATGARLEGDVMLALHARRSAAPVAEWHARRGSRGLAVVLTGTDLYRDITSDAGAAASLERASLLVVLQECGPDALAPRLRGKVRVIFQSTPRLEPLEKPAGGVHAVMVGHLRPEKDPETLFRAARLLAGDAAISIEHIGLAEGEWEARARAAERDAPGYRWVGALPHQETRERIRRAHVLVHTSAMEGGAHVVMEAVCSGTPVLGSRIPGNVGMLGDGYAGYFAPGDAQALADLLRACAGPTGDVLARLQAQCERRAALFDPDAEQASLRSLVNELLESA